MPRPVALLRPFHPEAVRAAREIEEDLELRDPADIDLVAIAAHIGAHVRARRLEREAAHSLRAGALASVTLDPLRNAGFVWRWVLAHELGHVTCDGAHDDFARCTRDNPTRATRRVEARASDFGTLLTMPETMFAPRWRTRRAPTMDVLRWMARTFAVPTEAAALRALGFEEEACAAVYSVSGTGADTPPRVKWWARSNERFDATIRWGRRVDEGTLAWQLHRGAGERGIVARSVPDALWGKTSDGAEIVEHATRVDGGVLTWLWIPGRNESA